MAAIHIFVSFDDEHDRDLCDEIQDQARRPGSGFQVSAWTRHGKMNETWEATTRAQIGAADEVVVLCGEHTDASSRVAAELRIVQESGKPYLLLWGRRDLMCKKPAGARNADAMYSWTRDTLESQMSAAIRSAQPPHIPDSCKRRPS